MNNLRNITRDHIIEAARQIDKEGVHRRYKSRRYYVIVDGKKYPPPLIVRKAYKEANGYEPRPYELRAQEALSLLNRLGFPIVPIDMEP